MSRNETIDMSLGLKISYRRQAWRFSKKPAVLSSFSQGSALARLTAIFRQTNIFNTETGVQTLICCCNFNLNLRPRPKRCR